MILHFFPQFFQCFILILYEQHLYTYNILMMNDIRQWKKKSIRTLNELIASVYHTFYSSYTRGQKRIIVWSISLSYQYVFLCISKFIENKGHRKQNIEYQYIKVTFQLLSSLCWLKQIFKIFQFRILYAFHL